MSDTQAPVTSSPEATPTTTTTANPAPTPEEIVSRAVEAAKAAVAAEKGGTVDKSQVQELLDEQRKQIARSLLGETEKEKVNPLLKRFVHDPEGFVGDLLGLAKEQTREEVIAEVEMKREFERVFDSRPDLDDEDAKRVFAAYLTATDAEKPLKVRIKEAVSAYDAHIEKLTGKPAKERVTHAATIRAGASPETPQEPKRVKESDTWAEELKELAESRKAKLAAG